MDINIQMIDEVSIIFFWVGLSGLIDRFINNPLILPSKKYVYMILVLIAIFIKL